MPKKKFITLILTTGEKSGLTNKICKEFNVKEVPSLIKIKSGKTVEKRDLSKFIEKNNISADRRFLFIKLKERKQTFLYLKGMFLLYNHVYNYFLLFNCINFTVILIPIYQA